MSNLTLRRRSWVALAVVGVTGVAMMGFALGALSSGGTSAQASASAAQPSNAAAQPPNAVSLNVRLDEWHVVAGATRVPAGTLTIVATNVGEVAHDLVIVRTEAAPSELPVAGDRVDETAITLAGRFQEFKSGDKEKHFQLEAGHYLLICNLPKHYQRGMVTELTVN